MANMKSNEKLNYRLVPCIKPCKSFQSFSRLGCAKKFEDIEIFDKVEEIEGTCDCTADYGCQNCKTEESENDVSTSEKIVNCLIFDGLEETDKIHDCNIDDNCQGCESKYSDGIPQIHSPSSEKLVNCIDFGVDDKFGNSCDCKIDNNCSGWETKDSDELSQNDLSTSETLVNCTTFEGIEINNDCKVCEGCEIKDSLGDRQNDRPSTVKIVECEKIDAEEEIEESYDCVINNDCQACQTKEFQGNIQNDWPTTEKMSATDGLKCVKKMMQEWKNDKAMRGWKFIAEFIGMDRVEDSDFYNYQVRWSFPTAAYPEPQVTVSVFFTVEAPRKKHQKCPVDVTYVFEGNQFPHRPKMAFRPKWIYDVLDMKTMIFKSFKF